MSLWNNGFSHKTNEKNSEISALASKERSSQKILQAGIKFKKNLRVRFGKYEGLKLEYF